MTSLAIIVVGTTYWVINTIIKGWVLSKLWVWFIANIFDTIEIKVVQCMGVIIVCEFLTSHLAPILNKEQLAKAMQEGADNPVEAITAAIGKLCIPLYWLLIGYVVQMFL